MILNLKDVSIAFGEKRVLDGVSFTIQRGEAVALMGPNGAGKTTILRCILGLLMYDGHIDVAGWDAHKQGVQARRNIGYVPQAPAFYDMTAREVLHFVARLRGVSMKDAGEALARVGLGADADRGVRTFSGGMQQRLSLAAALLGDPPIILLDEPTANLDAEARRDLLALLDEFHRAGKTLLLSSHRPYEVSELADRVILLRGGRVEREGKPDAVLPPGRMTLIVEAHGAEEKARVAGLLVPHGAVPLHTTNGSYEAVVGAREIVPAVERLRESGVARERIALRPVEDGGLS